METISKEDVDNTTVLKPGDHIISALEDEAGKAFYEAKYRLEAGPNYNPETGAGLVAILEEEHDNQTVMESANLGAAEAGVDKFDVLKWVWEFIKENKPITKVDNISTHALASEDPDPQHYEAAQEGKSAQVTWHCYNPWPRFDLVRVKVGIRGYYGARPTLASIPPGQYLPLVYTNVGECVVRWPLSLNATANVLGVVNQGSGGKLDPRMDIKLSLEATDFIESLRIELLFCAKGSQGLWYAGLARDKLGAIDIQDINVAKVESPHTVTLTGSQGLLHEDARAQHVFIPDRYAKEEAGGPTPGQFYNVKFKVAGTKERIAKMLYVGHAGEYQRYVFSKS